MENNDLDLVDATFPIKIGGQEFLTSKFTDKDWGDLDGYIKAKFLHLIREVTKLMTDEDEASHIMTVAVSRSINIGWATKEGNDIIWRNDGDGILHLGYHFIRKRHNKLTFTSFERIAKKDLKESLQQIMNAWEFHYPIKKDDVGGSSTGSEKSE